MSRAWAGYAGSAAGSYQAKTFEPVGRTLAGQIGDDDVVLATLPEDVCTGSLAYYFYRAGVPLNALARPPDTAQFLFVVVPLDASDTLLNLMRTTDVRLGDSGPPVLLERYAHSELYVVDRRQSWGHRTVASLHVVGRRHSLV